VEETLVKWIMVQIVLALGAVHDHGYIYSDLKPEQVLIDEDGYIKLADF
jgi:serine/threonine protein kinase